MRLQSLSLAHDSEVIACLTMAALILITEIIVPPRSRRVALNIQANHIIPSAVQVILITYWSLYWVEAWDVPRIPLELLFAFELDYFLDRCRGRTWRR